MGEVKTEQEEAPKRKKASYIGVPAIFKLELACKHLNEAFGDGHRCYLVGSALKKPDWRDVDVVMILSDNDFRRLFPKAHLQGEWEFDPRWLVMTVAISGWLKEQTGLPVDFKFQPQSWANSKHDGQRNPLGLRYVPNDDPMPSWEES